MDGFFISLKKVAFKLIIKRRQTFIKTQNFVPKKYFETEFQNHKKFPATKMFDAKKWPKKGYFLPNFV